MTNALVPCPACCRHLRATEPACPFCRAPRPLAGPSTDATASGALRLAGALLAATVSLTGLADAQPVHPRIGMEHAPAQGYGAPPFRGPGLEGPGGPIERRPPPPAVPPVVEPGMRLPRTRVTVSVSPTGARAAQLRGAMQSRSALWETCRDVAPSRLPERFSARLRVTLGGDGRVASVGVYNAPAAVMPVARCFVTRLRAVQLPPGAPTRVDVTMTYSARAEQPAVIRPGGIGQTGRCGGGSPAGCRRTGCEAGMVCDTRVRCVPSSCGCDEATGQWTCTSDCGGGVCVPAPR